MHLHLRRLLTAALVVTPVLLLPAAPAGAARGPDSRGEGVQVPRLSCAGDTVVVTAVVRGLRDVGPSTVTLHASAGGVWTATGRSTSSPRTGPGRSTWTLDATGLRVGVTGLRAEIRAAGASVLTPAVPVTSCAPGTEVPEVPVAALLPLTLAATATGVLAARHRRGAPLPA